MKPQGNDFNIYLEKVEQAKRDADAAENAALAADAEGKPATAEAKRKEAEAKRAEAEVLEIDAKQAEAKQAETKAGELDQEAKQAEAKAGELDQEAKQAEAEAEQARKKTENAKGKKAKKEAKGKQQKAEETAGTKRRAAEDARESAVTKRGEADTKRGIAKDAEEKRTAAEVKKAKADKELHDAQINQKIEEAQGNPKELDKILKGGAYEYMFEDNGMEGFFDHFINSPKTATDIGEGLKFWNLEDEKDYWSRRAKKGETYKDSNGNSYCTEWATIKCNQSTHFLKLRLLPGLRKMKAADIPIASTYDNLPLINVPLEPWNRCYSLLNPATLAATTAHFAATKVWKIIPMPCLFVPLGHWKGMANVCDSELGNFAIALIPTYIKAFDWWFWDMADYPKAQALTQDCTLSCLFAGEITINQCGQKDATKVPYNIVTGLIGPDIFSCLHNALGVLSNHVGLAGSLLIAAADSIVTGIESDSVAEGFKQFAVQAVMIGVGARIGKSMKASPKLNKLASKFLSADSSNFLEQFKKRKVLNTILAVQNPQAALTDLGVMGGNKVGGLINNKLVNWRAKSVGDNGGGNESSAPTQQRAATPNSETPSTPSVTNHPVEEVANMNPPQSGELTTFTDLYNKKKEKNTKMQERKKNRENDSEKMTSEEIKRNEEESKEKQSQIDALTNQELEEISNTEIISRKQKRDEIAGELDKLQNEKNPEYKKTEEFTNDYVEGYKRKSKEIDEELARLEDKENPNYKKNEEFSNYEINTHQSYSELLQSRIDELKKMQPEDFTNPNIEKLKRKHENEQSANHDPEVINAQEAEKRRQIHELETKKAENDIKVRESQKRARESEIEEKKQKKAETEQNIKDEQEAERQRQINKTKVQKEQADQEVTAAQTAEKNRQIDVMRKEKGEIDRQTRRMREKMYDDETQRIANDYNRQIYNMEKQILDCWNSYSEFRSYFNWLYKGIGFVDNASDKGADVDLISTLYKQFKKNETKVKG